MKKIILVLLMLMMVENVYARGFKFGMIKNLRHLRDYNSTDVLNFNEIKNCLLERDKIGIYNDKTEQYNKLYDKLNDDLKVATSIGDTQIIRYYEEKINKMIQEANKMIQEAKIERAKYEVECLKKKAYQDDYDGAIKEMRQD